MSSNLQLSAMHSNAAKYAVGQNCPVSIELIVFLEEPTFSASCVCVSPAFCLYSFNLFFNLRCEFTVIPPDQQTRK